MTRAQGMATFFGAIAVAGALAQACATLPGIVGSLASPERPPGSAPGSGAGSSAGSAAGSPSPPPAPTAASGSPAPAASAAHPLSASDFIAIPPGTFTMGSPIAEPGRFSEETPHQVILTRGFYLQATEVTQHQWDALLGQNAAAFRGADLPVEMVTWWEALAFANALSAREGLAACYSLDGCSGQAGNGMLCSSVTVSGTGGNPYDCVGYRLPTEAEWEYAYRAGTTTATYLGALTQTEAEPLDPTLDAIGWYRPNSGLTTRPPAGKQANPWGLHDMAGNVWEWVWDWHGWYSGPVTDPTGPAEGTLRILRGGSWWSIARDARAARRRYELPESRVNRFGFRLARSRP